MGFYYSPQDRRKVDSWSTLIRRNFELVNRRYRRIYVPCPLSHGQDEESMARMKDPSDDLARAKLSSQPRIVACRSGGMNIRLFPHPLGGRGCSGSSLAQWVVPRCLLPKLLYLRSFQSLCWASMGSSVLQCAWQARADPRQLLWWHYQRIYVQPYCSWGRGMLLELWLLWYDTHASCPTFTLP
jgi:hypothetical protein